MRCKPRQGEAACYAFAMPSRTETVMRMKLAILPLLALSLLLTACGGGPKKRINPPGASLQELTAQANGQWRLSLRVQNYSNVPITFDAIDATLKIGGQDAGRFNAAPALTVGPESSDVIVISMTPSLAAKTIVATALASGQRAGYTLGGRIRTHDPKRDDDFNYESALSPAPGLPGVMR